MRELINEETRVCDICKTKLTLNTNNNTFYAFDAWAIININVYGEEYFDVCPVCQVKIKDFISELKGK